MTREQTVDVDDATEPRATASVVRPSVDALGTLRPLGAAQVRLDGGFWGDRQAINRSRTIPHGFAQLGAAGTLDNLRLAAGATGTYQALQDSSGAAFPFLDSDVYKWLEAAGWELGRAHDPQLAADADVAIALVEAAQRAGRLPQQLCPGRRRRRAVPGPGLGPRAVLPRPPHPGGRGLAAGAR